ncbi:phage holin [Staphylococcus saprophyticus]|nr:phage holin [Staphylococcus saprophyticus]MDW4448411.1 phage holin [Staphylococcus saprophyticus]
MNFILRLKNKATLTAIVGAILLFIKQITEAFGVDLSAEIEQVSGLIGAIITFLVGIGVVTDPTTVGVKDSGITKTYAKPRDENIDPVEYQREGNTFTPKEYDTREDFFDDSDEIEFYSTLVDGGQHPDDAKHLKDEEQPEDDTDEGLGQRGVDNGKN